MRKEQAIKFVLQFFFNGFNQGEKQMIVTYEASTNFWPIQIWNPQPMTV